MPPKRKAATAKTKGAKKAKTDTPVKTAAVGKPAKAVAKGAKAPAAGKGGKAPAGGKGGKAPAAGKGGKKPAAGKRGAKAKPKKEESDEEEVVTTSKTQQIVDALKKSAGNKQRKPKVDAMCTSLGPNKQVLDDYDCMLNQTNIGNNNNKYYVIQVIEHVGSYYTWNRWGRVGEPGTNSFKGPMAKDKATADFKKKFQDKTKNNWSNRNNFQAVPGKYTLLEMGDEDEVDSTPKLKKTPTDYTSPSADCTLDKKTQDLIKLIFDNNMFQDALKDLEIDVKKMPLGKISKTQIAKGFEALEEVETAIKNKAKPGLLAELSSKFYTLIPHNFGRQRPPSIGDDESLHRKFDLLTVLGDIEVAQTMQKEKEGEAVKSGLRPHPLDAKYQMLNADLEVVDPKSAEMKVLEKYVTATAIGKQKTGGIEVWRLNRHSEGPRFSVNKKIENRKLLWHGTNVAVVAAILKSGLRIMPHSGGRVGKGIYFASENSKSAGYVRAARDIGIMFLNEVALGKEYSITMDDYRLTAAPAGFDSIVARGRTEPDPKLDTHLDIEEHNVVVPQGPPIAQAAYQMSNFSQSEYLVYREDQVRMRYLLKLKF